MLKTLPIVIQAMRPAQWTKNVALLVALVFAQKLSDPVALGTALAAFAVFCLLSGGTYILNDLWDLEQDRRHPRKSQRPLAAGKMSEGQARVASAGLLLIAVVLAFVIQRTFGVAALAYLGLQLAYSLRLKHMVIIDTFCIATSFFLRVLAGALAIAVDVSSWLLVCTFFVSLFIALGKRRHEMMLLEADATDHREVLGKYDVLLLDQMISVVTSATVVCYAVYTLWPETVERFGTTNLKYTIPFVLYGIYRYLYLVYRQQQGGAPETLVYRDIPMLVNLLAYAGTVVIILYS